MPGINETDYVLENVDNIFLTICSFNQLEKNIISSIPPPNFLSSLDESVSGEKMDLLAHLSEGNVFPNRHTVSYICNW